MSWVDVSLADNDLHYLAWPQQGKRKRTYVIGIRQLQYQSSVSPEWVAMLTNPSSGSIKLDTSEIFDDTQLQVDVLECQSRHQHGHDALRYFNTVHVGSAQVEVDSQQDDLYGFLASMSRLQLSSSNTTHRNGATKQNDGTFSHTCDSSDSKITRPGRGRSAGTRRQPTASPVFTLNYQRRFPRSSQTRLDVEVERQRFDEAEVSWISITSPHKWQVIVEEINEDWSRTLKEVYFVDGSSRQLELSKPLSARQRYRVTVKALQLQCCTNCFDGYTITNQESTEFLAVLSLDEMDQLLDRAIDAVNYSNETSPCKVLYRNKSRSYFEKIKRHHGGIMAAYIKDHSGDRLSPINGQINGLFFMAEVEPGSSEPCHASAFGNTRLVVPVEALREVAPKLYFADYYCMKGKCHYVTLVMTAQDSDADNFCSQHLPSLSIAGRNHNKFFYRNTNGNYRVSSGVKVEILFTEDVNVGFLIRHRGAEMRYNIPLIGKGHSTPGGVPKRDDCRQCNLYPISDDEDEDDDDDDYYDYYDDE